MILYISYTQPDDTHTHTHTHVDMLAIRFNSNSSPHETEHNEFFS